MKILILARLYPFPPDTGASRRVAALTTGLARANHSITLLTLRDHAKDSKSHEQSSPTLWQERVISYKSNALVVSIRSTLQGYTYHEAKFWCTDFKQAVDEVLTEEKHDVVIVNFLTMSRYLDGWLNIPGNSKRHRPLFVLDQHNLDELVWQSHVDFSSNFMRRKYALNQLDRIKRLQHTWLSRYDVVYSVSQDDLEGTRPYLSTNTRQMLVPNGVDTEYFQPGRPQKRSGNPPVLVFVAAMDVTMNQDAVNWFVRNVFPQVQQSHPDAQLWIVGRNPSTGIQNLSRYRGIRVTGTVPDVRDYYRKADVCVVPLRMGGGTKLKTLEAMAMGVPLVSTTVGIQGLEVENERHFFLADEAPRFAQRIEQLLLENETAIKMGKEARALVCERYSWQQIVDGVENNLQNMLQLKHREE